MGKFHKIFSRWGFMVLNPALQGAPLKPFGKFLVSKAFYHALDCIIPCCGVNEIICRFSDRLDYQQQILESY